MIDTKRLHDRMTDAVRTFWSTRVAQHTEQGSASGVRDAGNRGAVTGGKHLDGFLSLLTELVREAGVPAASIHSQVRRQTHLPGFFRPTKAWDFVVVHRGRLVATIEFKSQVGSFGNNFNNRCEESIGSAHDFWTAYREGLLKSSPRPWLGFLMLVEDAPASRAKVRVEEPHFKADGAYQDASYIRRYEILATRMVRERLYDAAALIVTTQKDGAQGGYAETNEELRLIGFAASLVAHCAATAFE
jgi:hypothetical protein